MSWPESREKKKIQRKEDRIQFQQVVELLHLFEKERGQATKQIK